MPRVRFVREGRELEVPRGRRLRDAARDLDIPVQRGLRRWLNCRGHGLCGSCRVRVSPAEALSPPWPWEEIRGLDSDERLACQARVEADVEVTTLV